MVGIMSKTNSENNESEKQDEPRKKSYSTAFRISIKGGGISFLFVLLAVLTLFNGTDSAGPSFFIFGFIAIAVFVISGLIAIFISLAEIVNYIIARTQNSDLAQNLTDEIEINIIIIVGILLAFLAAFKLFTTIW